MRDDGRGRGQRDRERGREGEEDEGGVGLVGSETCSLSRFFLIIRQYISLIISGRWAQSKTGKQLVKFVKCTIQVKDNVHYMYGSQKFGSPTEYS